jgi:LPS sulfotransferase NodH
VNPQLICIVARQRSGTTALQGILAQTGRVESFGEIFHTDRLDKPGSFFGFCRDKKVLLSDVAAAPDLEKLCRRYLEHLTTIAGRKHRLIDVKYNSWDAVRPAWRYPQEEPFFLSFLKRMDTLFIFVRRLDIAEQIISGHIARANDQWQNLALTSSNQAQIEIDIGKVRREARFICQAESFLWRHLKSYKRLLHFTYETLYEDSNLALEARARISEALGGNLAFPDIPPIRKNEVDKAASVKNYQAVVAAVEKVVATYKRPMTG